MAEEALVGNLMSGNTGSRFALQNSNSKHDVGRYYTVNQPL